MALLLSPSSATGFCGYRNIKLCPAFQALSAALPPLQCVLFWQDGSSILPFVAIFITVALEKKRHFWKSKWLWELWHIGKVSWLLKRLRPACSKVIKVYKLAWWINDEILLLQFPVGPGESFLSAKIIWPLELCLFSRISSELLFITPLSVCAANV